MPKIITRRNIIEEDAITWSVDYKKHLEAADSAQLKLVNSAKELNDLLKKNKKEGSTGGDKEVKLLNQMQEATNARARAENTLIKAIEKKKIASENANKATISERVEINRINKGIRQEATLSNKLVGAYTKLNLKRTKAKKNLQDLTVELGHNNKKTIEAKKVFDQLDKKVKQADHAVGDFTKNVGNYKSGLGGAIKLTRNLVGAFGAYQGLRLAKALFEEVKELNGVNTALKNILPSSESYVKSLDFLKTKSQAYGVELTSLTKNYTKFLASIKGTNLEGKKGIDIFDKVTKVSASLGNSQDETNGILTAFNQIISKGTVQSEELKGQLGDRIPGALNIMARALDVTLPKLNKMLQNGEVLADNALPKFAKELEKTFGVENVNRIENLTSAQTRFSNTYKIALTEIEQGSGVISKAFIGFFNLGTSIFGSISPVKKLSESLTDQNTNLNTLVGSITSVNTSTEARTANIKELQRNYPDFLKNLDAEKVSNKELEEQLKKVNEQYEDKIRYQIIEEDIVENKVKLSDLLREERDLLKAIESNEKKLSKGTVKRGLQGISTTKNANKAKKQRIEEIKKERAVILGLITSLNREQNAIEGVVEEKNKETKSTKELTAAEKRRLEQERKRLALLKESETRSKSDLAIARIEEEIRLNNIVINNENSSFDVRFKNVALLNKNQIKLSDSKYKEEKRLLKKALDSERITKEEHQVRLDILQIKSSGKIDEINKKKEDNVKKLIKERFDFYQNENNRFQRVLTNHFDNELKDLNNKFSKGLISRKAYEDALLKLNNDAQKGLINASIDTLKKALENDKDLEDGKRLSAERRKEIEQQIHDLEVRLSGEGVIIKKENQDKYLESIRGVSNFIADSLGLDARNIENFIVGITTKFENESEKWQVSLAVIGDVIGTIGDISSENSQRRINDIDYEIEKNNEHFQNRINNDNLSEEQKTLLENQRRVKEEKLNKEKKKEQEKQAKQAKALAVLQIVLNTAAAIIGALSPTTGLGPVAGIPFSIAAGVTGAVQLATVLAAPLPKFKDGHLAGTYEGWAITNDGGVPEVHESQGKARIIQGTNTPTYMEKGDKIHKSVDSFKKIENNKITEDFYANGLRMEKAQRDLSKKQNFNEEYLAVLVAKEVSKANNLSITKAIKEGFRNQKNNFNIVVEKEQPVDEEREY